MSEETIVQVFWRRATETPDRSAIMYKVDGAYQTVSWKEHASMVRKIAGGLLKLGIKAQDNVAIMSMSRPHWTWADIAILSCGAATVPIYPTLTAPEIQYLVTHSDAVCPLCGK